MGAQESKTRIENKNIVITEKKLGKGSFGTVYQGYYKNDPSTHLAIKIFNDEKSFMEELEIARKLKEYVSKCPQYFMCMEEYFMNPDENLYYIVYRKASSDLHSYMENLGMSYIERHTATYDEPYDPFYVYNLSDTNIYECINTLVMILDALDSLKLGHRDIKDKNILVNTTGPIRLMLGDMGLMCRRKGSPVKIRQCKGDVAMGTPGYVPPFLLQNKIYIEDEDPMLHDIYSTGVTLYSFLTGMRFSMSKSPFLSFPRDIKPVINGVKYKIPKQDINDLVNSMIFFETVDEALSYRTTWKKYAKLQALPKPSPKRKTVKRKSKKTSKRKAKR